MTLYYQCPPTGEYPSVRLPEEEMKRSWVYKWDRGWVPATSSRWSWHIHGSLLIPEVVIESWESHRIVVEHVTRALRELRLDGCYGVWSREFWALPSAEGDVNWMLKAGLIWNPDPTFLSRCQADKQLHERRGQDYEGSLAWQRLDGPFELWFKIPKVGTPWAAGLDRKGWPPLGQRLASLVEQSQEHLRVVSKALLPVNPEDEALVAAQVQKSYDKIVVKPITRKLP